jgi:hypothetical protein
LQLHRNTFSGPAIDRHTQMILAGEVHHFCLAIGPLLLHFCGPVWLFVFHFAALVIQGISSLCPACTNIFLLSSLSL